MTAKLQEHRERGVAAEFLRSMSIPFSNLQSLSEFCPDHDPRDIAGPDVKVDLEAGQRRHRVGIEVTDYHHDVGKHGSARRRIDHLCELLRGSYYDHCLPKHPSLACLCVNVVFRDAGLPKKTDVPVLAGQLADFLDQESGSIGGWAVFCPTHFAKSSALAKHVERIRVSRRSTKVSKTGYFNGYGTQVAVDPHVICRLIDDHGKAKYDLSDVEECWLLICAVGEPGSFAGPEDISGPDLHSAEIDACVGRSRFRRVFFWERTCQWWTPLGQVQDCRSREVANVP